MPCLVRISAGTLGAAPVSDGERYGAGRQRAGGPRPGVADGGPLVEGQRLGAEVQGRHLPAGVAAEHDGTGARPETGEVDAEGAGVAAVRVEAKSLAHRGDRDLPADGEMAAADDDFDAGAEHPGLGVGEHPGAEGVPAAQLTPDLRLLGDVGAHGVIGEAQQAAQDRVGR